MNMNNDVFTFGGNFEAIAGYFGQDYAGMVQTLVKAWDDAATIEMKDRICQSEIVQRFSTPTSLSIFYRLSFPKVTVTVQKIFLTELYDRTGKQDEFTIADDLTLIIGVQPTE